MKKTKFLLFAFMSNQALALNNDLNLINANEAYLQQITGNGIKIGIIDGSVNGNHPSLQGKILDQNFATQADGKKYTPNFEIDTHGSHVAGIALGKKIGQNDPQGVAYDAQGYVIQQTGHNTTQKLTPTDPYAYFKDKDVKIINNSWNNNLYPLINMSTPGNYLPQWGFNDPNQVIGTATNSSNPMSKGLIELAKTKEVLMVFSSGNEGLIAPGMMGSLPSYDESLRSFISVGALDSAHITKDSKGIIKVGAKGVAEYSNGFYGAQLYSLMAPGSSIKNADSSYGTPQTDIFGNPTGKTNTNLYLTQSGTSMSAPMVSGAAALIAQKFPFLTGKQIADVLLSTANKDYQAPKLTVKETDIDTIVGNNLVKKTYYTVFYIDTPVPTDENIIRADLTQAGYDANKVLSNRITQYYLVDETQYASIQSVSKETIFGQGILDIAKALKGLSILDANRLNSKDVSNIYGSNEAYYTLNLQNNEAVFDNDISQRKWDTALHRNDALNSPAKTIENLNVGLIVEGGGKLTLRGNNSYEGMSVVKNSHLSLLKRADKSGGVLSGSVRVSQDGKFNSNGTIKKDLYNEGLVRAGNEDLEDLNVLGKYTQTQSASLQLEFGNTKNSKLLANSYEIQGGKLQYLPIPAFYTSGTPLSIDLGNLKTYLDNFNTVEVAGNNALNFVAVLDSDKTSINKVQDPDQNQPTKPEELQPSQPPSSTITPNPDNTITITPIIKPDAYETSNADTGKTLRAIRAKDNLNNDYKKYFGFLDNTDKQTQSKALDTIESQDYLSNISQTYTEQYKLAQSNLLFALNPSFIQASNFALNLEKNPILTAFGAGDVFIDLGIKNLEEKKYIFYLSPSYKRIFADDYNGQSIGLGFNIGARKNNSQFIFNVNLADSKLDYDDADFKSQQVHFSFNYILDLEQFKILSAAGLGYIGNDTQRRILGNNQNLEGSYKNVLGSWQLGVAKDFFTSNFTLTPLIYLNYIHIWQDSFSENGGIFAKDYESINHSSFSLATGANFLYSLEGDTYTQNLSSFIVYERRLNGKKVHNKVQFKDFPDLKINQNYNLEQDFITLGLNLEYLFSNSFFINFSLINEFTKKQYNINFLSNLGLKF